MYKILIIISLFFFACKSYHSEKQTENTQTAPAETQAAAEKIFTNYLALKDALVKTDAQTAKSQAILLAEAAKAAETDKVIFVQAKEMAQVATLLSQTEDVEKQRAEFSKLSHTAYNIVKMTGIRKGKIFKQFCPMAFDDKGDYWLSGEKQIMNPYFGDKMLHCGKVEEEL